MGKYSVIKKFCTSNGPGVRTAIYLSGCTLHCKGCFNYEIWDFNSGEELTTDVENEIIESIQPDYIQGLSILGGEPLDELNQKSVYDLLKQFKKKLKNKDVWLWTGYRLESIPHTEYTDYILKNVDVIVDGPFELEKQDIMMQYAGSSNQRVLYKGKDF